MAEIYEVSYCSVKIKLWPSSNVAYKLLWSQGTTQFSFSKYVLRIYQSHQYSWVSPIRETSRNWQLQQAILFDFCKCKVNITLDDISSTYVQILICTTLCQVWVDLQILKSMDLAHPEKQDSSTNLENLPGLQIFFKKKCVGCLNPPPHECSLHMNSQHMYLLWQWRKFIVQYLK